MHALVYVMCVVHWGARYRWPFLALTTTCARALCCGPTWSICTDTFLPPILSCECRRAVLSHIETCLQHHLCRTVCACQSTVCCAVRPTVMCIHMLCVHLLCVQRCPRTGAAPLGSKTDSTQLDWIGDALAFANLQAQPHAPLA